ncbi:MAG: hypothetical protein QOC82_1224 [Frankiaceae bacterium]|jgi:hypothetical protein|nr:hypothetical protein [Frankiaceae bacterium]
MWHLSYGQIAAEQLAAAHAAAAHDALIAQLPGTASRRHPVRQAIGQLLIRVGARLVMPSAPTTTSAAR